LPDLHRSGYALQIDKSEVSTVEQATKLVASGRVDDDAIVAGQRLETGGEIRGLTDRCLLSCLAGADLLTDHHQTGCDADANPQFFGKQGVCDLSNDRQCGRTARSASSSRATGQPKYISTPSPT